MPILGFMPPRKSFLQRHELDQRRKIDASMEALVGDTRFADFMEEVGSLREAALDATNELEIIKSERATLACIAEATAYKRILNIYEDKRAAFIAKAELAREQREQSADAEQT